MSPGLPGIVHAHVEAVKNINAAAQIHNAMKIRTLLIIQGLFIFLMLLFTTGQSCRMGKDLPEADFAKLVLVSADTVQRYVSIRYVYRWYDVENKVTYIIYSDNKCGYKEGETIIGIIRK